MEVFGKCSNPNGHGHNYTLEVCVAGQLDPQTQMVIDASKLSALVEELVIRDVDHKNLNEDVPWLKDMLPTSESLVEAFWNRLAPAITMAAPKAALTELTLHETKRIWVVKRRQ